MLNPERIKEIEEWVSLVLETGVRGWGEETYGIARMLEDLLIERNCVILPAFKAALISKSELHNYLQGTPNDWIENEKDADIQLKEYCQRQWETFG